MHFVRDQYIWGKDNQTINDYTTKKENHYIRMTKLLTNYDNNYTMTEMIIIGFCEIL